MKRENGENHVIILNSKNLYPCFAKQKIAKKKKCRKGEFQGFIFALVLHR